jgi:hypothetical protein
MTTRIKLRRDTASNWTDINPVLALAEPGVETDTNKMKIGDGTTAWDKLQYIDGADVTRIKAGFITSVGNIPELGNGEGDDFWFESVAVDADQNSYYVGGNYNDDAPWAVKLNPTGGIEWQTKLGPFDGYAGEGQAIEIDPTNGQLVVIADMWGSIGSGGDAGMLLYRLDANDGSLIGNPTRIRDDQSANSVDIYPYDIQMDGNKAIIFGGRNDDKTSVEVAKQTGSTGTKIVILTNILESGAYPRAYNNWYISGTDVNGEGIVTAVNNYTNVASTGGGGNGAYFNISFYVYAGTTYKNSDIANSGTGYAVNDVLTLAAADAGASENVTITVTGIDGSGGVLAYTLTSYTPDLSKIMLTIDPNGGSVDFSNSGTWNLVQYKGDSGFIYSEQGNGWTAIVGDSDNDWFNVGAVDSNGNVYAAGYTYDDNYFNGWDRSMLVKFNNMGEVQYKKCFDFNGSEGADGYTGLAIDSQDNVYTAGYVYDFDNTGNWFHVITKINSSGVMQWQKAFNSGSDPYNMWNMCLAIDSDDNIYMAAEYNSPASLNDDFFFAKFDSSGNVIWQRMLKSFGDADAQWSNGYQSLKVQGDKLFYSASTEVYSTNSNTSALAFSINTDGSGVGTIANNTWEWAEVDLNWANTPNQTTSNLQVSVATAVFTTDEPVTGTDNTTYTTAELQVYTGDGGNVNGVRTITFEDGTVQTTASKPSIPQNIEGTLHGSSSLYLRLDHAGQFIRVNFWNGNQSIYVPTNSDVPFEIGTVITIIADDVNGNNCRIYIYSDGGYRNPEITGVGFQSSNPADWWELNNTTNEGKTGIYTLMKVDTDRWVLAGPDLQENWC